MQSSFNSFQEFLSMGGYGFYVWGAYGFLMSSFLLGAWLPWREHKQRLQNNADETTA